MKARRWRGRAASLAGSVAASDAFFPFRDGLDAVAAAGRHRGRAARRLGAGRRGDCGRRRARPRDGLHGPPALQALSRLADAAGSCRSAQARSASQQFVGETRGRAELRRPRCRRRGWPAARLRQRRARRPARAPASRSRCRRRRSRPTPRGRPPGSAPRRPPSSSAHAVLAARDQHALAAARARGRSRAARARVVVGADAHVRRDLRFVVVRRHERRAGVVVDVRDLRIDQHRHCRARARCSTMARHQRAA